MNAATSHPSSRRAVIDVGTNSVKLLVADVNGTEICPVLEESKQTRLGRGFYDTHELQPDAIRSTANAVARFADTARGLEAQAIRVIATSAARDAVNAAELTSAIASASAIQTEIISGEEEADLVFRGVTSDARVGGQSLLIMDIGGGSTELILGRALRQHFRQSFPLGTVRLLEQLPPSDPPTQGELDACRKHACAFLNCQVRPQLEPALREEVSHNSCGGITLIGTGGTTSILARMESELDSFDRERIESMQLNLERVRWHTQRLWSVSLSERQQIIGLPTKRADVILTGSVICEAIMETFGFTELRISTRGLRFAALMDGD